jgi:hypothetical protein
VNVMRQRRSKPPMQRVAEVLAVEVVSPRDLASILRVSSSYVRKCINAGTLKTLRIGDTHRITQGEALAFLRSLGVPIPDRVPDTSRTTHTT